MAGKKKTKKKKKQLAANHSTSSNSDEAMAVAASIEAIDFSPQACRSFHETQREIDAAHGFPVAPAATKDPDVPACDACGKEFSAHLICSRCQSAFYCSQECQHAHWKGRSRGNTNIEPSHKLACRYMQQNCQQAGREVVAGLRQCTMRGGLGANLVRLDGEGAYRAAIQDGLHEALQVIFAYERDNLLQTDASLQQLVCYTELIMCTLFRGQRCEGRGQQQDNTSFSCIDSRRICKYVLSHADAFCVWMDASMTALRLPLDSTVYGTAQHPIAQRCAREVWATWIQVLTRRSCAKAILLGQQPSERMPDVVQRVRTLGQQFRQLLADRRNIPDDRDPGCRLEGLLNQVCAMVAYWVKYFEIPLVFDAKMLELSGQMKEMYLQVALPLAEATIRKGSALTRQENQECLAAAAPPSRRRH